MYRILRQPIQVVDKSRDQYFSSLVSFLFGVTLATVSKTA